MNNAGSLKQDIFHAVSFKKIISFQTPIQLIIHQEAQIFDKCPPLLNLLPRLITHVKTKRVFVMIKHFFNIPAHLVFMVDFHGVII